MARTTLIEFRRGTAAAWTAANPTLAAGEPGFETDTLKAKIGDGATAWNSLAYFSGGGGVTSFNSRTGAVVPVSGDYEGVVATALTGATAATRYVGGTASGHPSSGTFQVGDFVIDQTGNLWVCTVAGTPGTWVSPAAGSGLPTGGATSQVVGYGGSSGTGAWVYPPGFEVGYAQITAPVNITNTTEATATALISCTATFDGAAVIAEFFCGAVFFENGALSDTLVFTLFEGSTQITRLAEFRVAQITNQDIKPVYSRYKFTPSAASHTYKLCAFVSDTTGTPQMSAGNGGTAGQPPAFLRFTKV